MPARCPEVSFALISVSRECGFPCFPWLIPCENRSHPGWGAAGKAGNQPALFSRARGRPSPPGVWAVVSPGGRRLLPPGVAACYPPGYEPVSPGGMGVVPLGVAGSYPRGYQARTPGGASLPSPRGWRKAAQGAIQPIPLPHPQGIEEREVVGEDRRFHFTNPLPCPQGGFGVFRGWPLRFMRGSRTTEVTETPLATRRVADGKMPKAQASPFHYHIHKSMI